MKPFWTESDIAPGRAAPGTSRFDPKAKFNAGFWAGALQEWAQRPGTRLTYPEKRSTLDLRLEDPFFFHGYLSGQSWQAMGEITAAGSHPAWREFLTDLQDPEIINLLERSCA